MHKLLSARARYLANVLTLKSEEVQRIEFYGDYLPMTIIDAHVHVNLPAHVTRVSAHAYNHMLSSFVSFSLEESTKLNRILYPKQDVRSLRTTQVFRGLDYRTANSYLLEKSSDDDRVAVFGAADDLAYTIELLHHENVAALKMYYLHNEPPAQTVYATFPKEVIKVAESLDIPLLVHLPTRLDQSWPEILDLKQDFPDIKVCIAHLGLSKFMVDGLPAVFKRIAEETDFVMDTAMNPAMEIYNLAFDTLGEDRIMFGSDAPINLVRSVPYIHPEKGQRIVADIKYHWQDLDEYRIYGHLAKNATHSHWLALDALKDALEASYSGVDYKNATCKIFYENARKFYTFKEVE